MQQIVDIMFPGQGVEVGIDLLWGEVENELPGGAVSDALIDGENINRNCLIDRTEASGFQGAPSRRVTNAMNKADRRKIARILSDPDLPHNQILHILGVLYFPPKLLADLHSFLEYNEFTPGQLVAKALKMQLPRWKKFYKFVMTPLKPGEPIVWPEDPMFALACVALVHWTRTLHKLMEHPDAMDATIEQLKKDAPTDWVFRSLEELEDNDDQADWWKVEESE
jgi:hypothetical protein